jgi:hypothetical protein
MLRKLLKGSDAEAAVPALLAARDAHLSLERESRQREQQDATAAAVAEAAAKAAPSCAICFEPYGGAAVPRILVACGHTFCELCLSQMLRCARLTARSAAEKVHLGHTIIRHVCPGMFVLCWLMIAAGAQAAAGEQRTEAAGVPEVQAALRCQGRARGRAADQLRHHGRLTGAGCTA